MNVLQVSLGNELYTEVPALVMLEEIKEFDWVLETLGVKVSNKEPTIKIVESLGSSVPEAVKLPERLFTTFLVQSVVENLAVEESLPNPFLEEEADYGECTAWEKMAQNLAEQAKEEEARGSSSSSSSSIPSPTSKPKKKKRLRGMAKVRAKTQAVQAPSQSKTATKLDQQAPSSLAMKKFVVQPSLGGDYNLSLTDGTRIACDLSNDVPGIAGHKHMFKRLNANYAIAKFVEQNQRELMSYTFNTPLFRGIFKATDYVIPSDYEHKTKRGRQRIHISMFSKFVMQNNKLEYYQLDGRILVNGREYTVKNFLNLCDIGLELLNDIDAYIELKGRLPMRALLEEVRKGSKDALTNVAEFAQCYAILLNELESHVKSDITVLAGRSWTREFEDPLLVKFAHRENKREVLKYIQGMLTAISDFVGHIDLERNGKPSALYAIG